MLLLTKRPEIAGIHSGGADEELRLPTGQSAQLANQADLSQAQHHSPAQELHDQHTLLLDSLHPYEAHPYADSDPADQHNKQRHINHPDALRLSKQQQMQQASGSPSANQEPAPAVSGAEQHITRTSPELPALEPSPNATVAAPRELDTLLSPDSQHHAGILLMGQPNAARICLRELASHNHNIVAGSVIPSSSSSYKPAGPHKQGVLGLGTSGNDLASPQPTDIAMQQARGQLPGIIPNGPSPAGHPLDVQHSQTEPGSADPDDHMPRETLTQQAYALLQDDILAGLGSSDPHKAFQSSQVGPDAAEPGQLALKRAAMQLAHQRNPEAALTNPAPVNTADTVHPSNSQAFHWHSAGMDGAAEPNLGMSREVALQLAAGMQQASSSIASLTTQLQAMQQLLMPFLQVHGLLSPPPEVAGVANLAPVSDAASPPENPAAGNPAIGISQSGLPIPASATSAPEQPVMPEEGEHRGNSTTVAQCSAFADTGPHAAAQHHHDAECLAGHHKRRRIIPGLERGT